MLFVAGCALLLVTTLVSVFCLALLKGTLLAFIEVEGPALLPGHHLSARVNILAKNGTITDKKISILSRECWQFMFRQKLEFPAQNDFFLPKFLQNIPPCLAVVLGDLLVGGLGALVALLALLPLYVAILFHVNLLAALLRDVPALLPRHLHALLLVLGHALLLGNLHTVLHIFAVLLGDVFAALGVGGLALLPGHGLALLLIAGGAMLFGNILRKRSLNIK